MYCARLALRSFLIALVAACGSVAAGADDLYLASSHAWPGAIWRSEGGGREVEVYRRPTTAEGHVPGAVPRVGAAAVTADGWTFFASCLDGYVLRKLGPHNVLVCRADGQVRDLAIGRENHTVYFSAVPTPRDGERLGDGKIYKYDWYDARPMVVATVDQEHVGGNWWGTFAMQGGQFYLATLADSSQIFKLEGSDLRREIESTGQRITSLAVRQDGEYVFTTGDTKVYATSDFRTIRTVLEASRRLTEATVPGEGRSE